MRKITIVGAGRVGETTAQILAEQDLCREIALLDVREDVPQGVALDICQTAPFFEFDCSLTGSNDPQIMRGSELLIVTAGLPRIAEPVGMLGETLFHGIGGKGADDGPAAGQHADEKAEKRAAQDRGPALPPVLTGGEQPLERRFEDFPVFRGLQVAQDLGKAEEAHDHDHEIDAVRQPADAQGEPRGSVDGIEADGPQEQTQDAHHQTLQDRFFGEIDRHHQAEKNETKVFGRSEFQGEGGECRGHDRYAQNGERTGDEGREGRDPQGRSGPSVRGPSCIRPGR